MTCGQNRCRGSGDTCNGGWLGDAGVAEGAQLGGKQLNLGPSGGTPAANASTYLRNARLTSRLH